MGRQRSLVVLAALLTAVCCATVAVELQGTTSLPPIASSALFVVSPLRKSGLRFSWSVQSSYNATSNDDALLGTFDYTGDFWVGIGLNSKSNMQGPIIVCYANRSSIEGHCTDYIGGQGKGGGLQLTATQITTTENVTFTSTACSITFRRIVKRVGGVETDIDLSGGSSRVLFAQGKWLPGDSLPTQHSKKDSTAMRINFQTGSYSEFSDGYLRWIFLSIAVFFVLNFAAAIRVVGRSSFQIHAAVRYAVFVLVFVLHVAIVSSYTYACYQDNVSSDESNPFWIALGHGVGLSFGLLLLPINKKLCDFLQCPFPWAINYHFLCAFGALICMSLHAYGMMVNDKKHTSEKVSGFFTLGLLVAVGGIAVFRKWIGFRFFRASHYLTIIILIVGAIHFSGLIVYLLPGLLLYVVCRWASHTLKRSESIVAFQHNALARTISIGVITRGRGVLPGQYYLLYVPEVSIHEIHPFSVCRVTSTEKVNIVHFCVKVTPNPNGWTHRLAQMAKSGKIPRALHLEGPHGVLEVQLSSCAHCLLISGGIGITPNLFLLQQIATSCDDSVVGKMEGLCSLTFIWVAQSRSLVAQFTPELHTYQQALSERLPRVAALFKVFVTESRDRRMMNEFDEISDDTPLPTYTPLTDEQVGANSNFSTVTGRRPAWAAELSVHRDGATRRSSTTLRHECCATYICGPSSMASEAEAAVRNASSAEFFSYRVHVERFGW